MVFKLFPVGLPQAQQAFLSTAAGNAHITVLAIPLTRTAT